MLLEKTAQTLLPSGIIGKLKRRWSEHQSVKEAQEVSLHFATFLRPVIANSDFKKDIVFRLRHKVYCEELSYEPLRDDELETDTFDNYAFHALIQHIKSRQYAGTVRIICPRDESEKLPIEVFCQDKILNAKFLPENFNRDDICEISRLAVPLEFRRRVSDQVSGAATGSFNDDVDEDNELRCFPFIAVGLYFSAAAMCLKLNKKHAFVMLEPQLARNLALVGIKFKQIGPITDYHGKRAPHYINSDLLFANLDSGFECMLENIRKSLYAQKL
ncbi:PEP-CTERM/exosortase system-associated acyltransferase [Glaciecola sp. MH2013]|uniref:PEP-CTERM/exosortase system-associated acyltransferase n=1 Tax=Glaciecola sp. MH2013 TaxID=2785524 RepID=UPI00189F028A|nr:PEP-CTERM/exosortase system-associated acyltransferase [Glaciecola sp. MH2013]MBF7072173.1 PEP-CTERM/exosortase system-associated acyltransferase [Glaciecola sp. MH2013]